MLVSFATFSTLPPPTRLLPNTQLPSGRTAHTLHHSVHNLYHVYALRCSTKYSTPLFPPQTFTQDLWREIRQTARFAADSHVTIMTQLVPVRALLCQHLKMRERRRRHVALLRPRAVSARPLSMDLASTLRHFHWQATRPPL